MATKANNALRYWKPGADITGKAIGAAIIGKRFVKVVSGGSVANPGIATAAADGLVFGVSQNDTPQNDTVGVNRDGAVSVTAGIALSAGDPVYSDAAGKAIKTGTLRAGTCLADTAINGDAPILLSL